VLGELLFYIFSIDFPCVCHQITFNVNAVDIQVSLPRCALLNDVAKGKYLVFESTSSAVASLFPQSLAIVSVIRRAIISHMSLQGIGGKVINCQFLQNIMHLPDSIAILIILLLFNSSEIVSLCCPAVTDGLIWRLLLWTCLG